MKSKTRFILKAAIYSGALFLIWPAVSKIQLGVEYWFATQFSVLFSLGLLKGAADSNYLLIPTLAIIAASSSADIRRKLKFALYALACQAAFGILVLVSGAGGLVENAGGAPDGLISTMVLMVRYSFPWILAVFVILLFVRDNPSMLWKAEPAPAPNARKCPICGKHKIGLADHIRSVHGEKSLKNARVRRVLESIR